MSSDHDGPRAPEPAMYCWRCDDVVRPVLPWPHWRKVWIGWICTIGLITVLFPVMASDFCVMIPTMMAIIVAGGPIYRYASQLPSCSVCSAVLDPARARGTGVRSKGQPSPPPDLA